MDIGVFFFIVDVCGVGILLIVSNVMNKYMIKLEIECFI